MKNKFSKFFTVGIIGLFSVSLASCNSNDESNVQDENIRNVNFETTYSARNEFNLDLIDLPTTPLELGTSLYDFVNGLNTDAIISQDSIFQDYAWLIDGNKINYDDVLEEDVTITLDAIRTHKQVLANVIMDPMNPVQGLNDGIQNFRKIVEPNHDVLYDEDIVRELKSFINEESHGGNLEITLNDSFEGFSELGNCTFVIDVIVGNFIPDNEHNLFSLDVDSIDVEDRFASHVDIQTGGVFFFPNAFFPPFNPEAEALYNLIVEVRHREIRQYVVNRVNHNNDDIITLTADDFRISTNGERPMIPEDYLFVLDLTVPTSTTPGNILLTYEMNTYALEVDSEVVELATSESSTLLVPRFLSDVRWNVAPSESENLYNVFIYNLLTMENKFQLIRTGAIVDELEEVNFTLETANHDVPGVLFELSTHNGTITVRDLENTGMIVNNTDNLLNLDEAANEISFPRALQLDGVAINSIVITRLVAMSEFSAEYFIINDSAHEDAFFNITVAGTTITITNINETFEINDRSTDFLAGQTWLAMALNNNTGNIVMARANVSNSLNTTLLNEFNSRVWDQFILLFPGDLFTFDVLAPGYIFVITPVQGRNEIEVTLSTAGMGTNTTPVIIHGLPGAVSPIVQNLITSNFAFYLDEDACILEELETLMIAIATNGVFGGYQFEMEPGNAVIGFSTEISGVTDDVLRSTNVMLGVANYVDTPEFSGEITLRAIVQEEFIGLDFERNETGFTVTGFLPGDYHMVNGHLFIPTFFTDETGFTGRVTRIAANAFASASGIQSVTLPLFIERIEAHAFANARMGGAIRLENLPMLHYIGEFAFANQPGTGRNLVLYNLPSLITIGASAFQEVGLSSVELRNLPNLINIGNRAFRGTGVLNRIYLEGLNVNLSWPTHGQQTGAFNPDGWVTRTVTMLGSWDHQPIWWSTRNNIFTGGPNPRFVNASGNNVTF